MTRTVTLTCTITFSVGESFGGGHQISMGNTGDVVEVVSDNNGVLLVSKNNGPAFIIQPGQYK